MDNEIIVTAVFLFAGLLACVIVPDQLVIWDRVPGLMGGDKAKRQCTASGIHQERPPPIPFSFKNTDH